MKTRETRELGQGKPKRVLVPTRRRRPVENWKKRSRELKSVSDPDTRL